jgi:hypothetical protein
MAAPMQTFTNRGEVQMNNSKNGKYGTENIYFIMSNITGNIVATAATRKEARNTKRNLTTNLGVKNTTLTVRQVSTSVVR